MTLHPDIKIADITPPTGGFAGQTAWVDTRMLAGRMPDIYEPGTVSVTLSGVPKKFWVALDPYLDRPNPYVKGNKRWRDLILPGLLDQGKYLDNKTYCFNADAAEWAIFYNKDIFKKVGVSVPTTWAELMAISRKLVAAGYGAFSTQGAPAAGSIFTLLVGVLQSMLWAGVFKNRPDEPYFMSPLDFCLAVKKGKLSMNHPRTRQAWQLLKAFSQYWTKGTLTATDIRTFTSGKTAMWYYGSWGIGQLQGAIKNKFDMGVFPIPPVTKESSSFAIGDTYTGIGAMASGNPLSIPSTTVSNGHLDLAIDFLQFYTQPDVIGPLALAGGETPAIVGIKNLPPLIKQVTEEVIVKQSLLGPVYLDLSVELTTKIAQLCQGYLAGALSLDSALSQLDQLQLQVATSTLASAGIS
jgi:ABC-type glycerol-3-phosphate transport system substrate-binding protein